VFRIDEDSFAVIAKGDDYDRLDEHLAELNEINAENTGENGLLIGYGAKRHEDENTVEEVLALAEKALEKYKENM
jgi:GGDEF domain-containing protein